MPRTVGSRGTNRVTRSTARVEARNVNFQARAAQNRAREAHRLVAAREFGLRSARPTPPTDDTIFGPQFSDNEDDTIFGPQFSDDDNPPPPPPPRRTAWDKIYAAWQAHPDPERPNRSIYLITVNTNQTSTGITLNSAKDTVAQFFQDNKAYFWKYKDADPQAAVNTGKLTNRRRLWATKAISPRGPDDAKFVDVNGVTVKTNMRLEPQGRARATLISDVSIEAVEETGTRFHRKHFHMVVIIEHRHILQVNVGYFRQFMRAAGFPYANIRFVPSSLRDALYYLVKERNPRGTRQLPPAMEQLVSEFETNPAVLVGGIPADAAVNAALQAEDDVNAALRALDLNG